MGEIQAKHKTKQNKKNSYIYNHNYKNTLFGISSNKLFLNTNLLLIHFFQWQIGITNLFGFLIFSRMLRIAKYFFSPNFDDKTLNDHFYSVDKKNLLPVFINCSQAKKIV